ncbi:uncharacterized protein LOC134836709 [Culicoides brevitarsis]|uniref:uncharacterized protein LOC134836709 n=1 Tax=Culicoides brevitarsis TaxID=469753 RepID=UPI00307BEEFE
MSSAGVHQHTEINPNPGTKNEDNKNPIYESIEDDVEHLEQMITLRDSNFHSVTREVWRDVVSPSSSISSINTSDSDDEDFSGYISIGGSFSFTRERRNANNNNFCDKSSAMSDADTEDTLNESRISLQEINMQIGVAEELVLTPNSRQKHNNKHLFTNLETIHEGKFLHTPPKNAADRSSPRTNKRKSSSLLFERLERD